MTLNRKAYILCGGQSRRMGRDKAMIDFKGERLLHYQINKITPLFEEIVLLSGNKNYKIENRQLMDDIEDAGPLSGLLSALKDGADHSLKHITLFPVDLPDLSDQTVERLSTSEPAEKSDAVILSSGEYLQPLAGVYGTGLNKKLKNYLESGNRIVFGFIKNISYSIIEVAPEELRNLNHPGD